jgi:SepF-like predicted cell division protein (DUF552 family)
MSETTETKKKKYEICVFRVFKDDECAECKSEIDAGNFVTIRLYPYELASTQSLEP